MSLLNIPTDYTADWSAGQAPLWCETSWEADNTNIFRDDDLLGRIAPTPQIVGEETCLRYSTMPRYIANGINAATQGLIQMQPNFILSARRDFEIVVPITINWPQNKAFYQAVALYNGEAAYLGIYLYTGGAGNDGYVQVIDCGYGNFRTSPQQLTIAGAAWQTNDKMTCKIVHDAAGGLTHLYLQRNAEAFQLLYTRTAAVVNGGSPLWLEPCGLWITGHAINSLPPVAQAVPFSWNVDIHPISITQEEQSTVILAGAGATYPWSYAPDWAANCWPYQRESHYEPSGITSPFAEYEIDTNVWEVSNGGGSTLTTTPLIEGDLQTLRLYGTARIPTDIAGTPVGAVAGVVRIRVLDEQDNVLSIGGSTEFYPDAGAHTSLDIDLSGLTQTAIKLEIYCEQETVVTYPWDSLVVVMTSAAMLGVLFHGFVVEGNLESASQTPCAKGKGSAVTIGATYGMVAQASVAAALGVTLLIEPVYIVTADVTCSEGAGSAITPTVTTPVVAMLTVSRGDGIATPIDPLFQQLAAGRIRDGNGSIVRAYRWQNDLYIEVSL